MQTYIGSILISVNPYKRIENLYSDDTLKKYSNKDIGDEPPHVYAIANECYTCMWKRRDNQCVLIRLVISFIMVCIDSAVYFCATGFKLGSLLLCISHVGNYIAGNFACY